MNNQTAKLFLTGAFDGKTRRQQTAFKKLVARQCCKPHSCYRVRVASEWAFY